MREVGYSPVGIHDNKTETESRGKRNQPVVIGMGNVGFQQLQAAATVPQIRIAAIAETHARPELREKPGIPLHKDWRRLLEDPSITIVGIHKLLVTNPAQAFARRVGLAGTIRFSR